MRAKTDVLSQAPYFEHKINVTFLRLDLIDRVLSLKSIYISRLFFQSPSPFEESKMLSQTL